MDDITPAHNPAYINVVALLADTPSNLASGASLTFCPTKQGSSSESRKLAAGTNSKQNTSHVFLCSCLLAS